MISQKTRLTGLLAVAALAAASSCAGSYSMPVTQTISRKRERYDEAMAWQKRIVEQRMTAEQRAWNAVVEAKRVAKKGKSK